MRIGFDAKRAFNNPAGLGNYSRILLNALAKYYPDNDYFLYTPRVKDEFFNELHGEFKILLPETQFQRSFRGLWRSCGLTKKLKEEKVHIYHGLSNELPFNIHESGVKSVVTIHDLIFLKHKEQYPFFDRQIYELKTRYATKRADKIIVPSNETKEDLMQYYRVPDKRIEVIYQSVDERFRISDFESRIEIKSKYQLPDKYILNVGSFFPRKNQRTLIEAFSLIKDKVEEGLVLIGSQGNLKNEMEQLIHQKKLQGRVKILSQVSNEDLPAIYQSASVFAFPSSYEGFGVPVLEALFSKVPVITSQGGCMEEAGGKSSLYINPLNTEEMASAILKVLNDSALKNKMIESGYAHALTMTTKNFAEKTMAVYNEIS